MTVTCGTCDNSMDLHGRFGTCPPPAAAPDGSPFPWEPFVPDDMHGDTIIAAVCYSYRITAEELLGQSRFATLTRPRRAAVWLLREVAGLSWQQIGEAMNRDLSTPITAYQRAVQQAGDDRRFRHELDTMALGLREIIDMPNATADQITAPEAAR